MAKKLINIISSALISLKLLTLPENTLSQAIEVPVYIEIQTQQIPKIPPIPTKNEVSDYYALEKTWLIKQSEDERKKSDAEVLDSYLPRDTIPKDLSAVSFGKKSSRQSASASIKGYHEKVSKEKLKSKEVLDKRGVMVIVDQHDGTKPLFDMVFSPEKYLASLPQNERDYFLYSQFAKLPNIPEEKKEFFKLRFGRLVPWEIDYNAPTLSDQLILYTLSGFYDDMAIPGENACRKKSKKDALKALGDREFLTLEEKIDFLSALNSIRMRQ